MLTYVKKAKIFGGILRFKLHTTLVLFTLIGILNSSNVLAQSSIDWSTANWPQGSTSGTVNLTTPAGFKQESVTINITRNANDGNFFSSAATGTFPKIDLASGGVFGGVDDLGVAFDPADTGRTNANSPVTITLNFSQNITNLRFGISDIDHSNGRVDRVTVTSNAGSPNSITIVDPPNTTVTSTTINSAQSSTASADSNNNDNGSIVVDFGSKSVRTVTIVYTDNNNSSGPRGTGFLGNFTLTTANIIDAVNDSATTTYGIGGTAVNNVLSNDILKTVAPTLSTVNLTQVSTTNSNVSLNTSTGAVNVSPNTPVGTYTLVYRICEKASTSNCDTASVTITVTPPDNDNDGIADDVDLDDDNDGILDTDEGYTCPSSNYVNLGQSFTNANTNTNGGTNSGTVLNTYSFNDANATLSYEVTNGATWSSGVASAGPTTGVDGNYVNVQSKDTNFPYGSNYQNNASSIKVAVYTLTFNKPVYNLELKWSGLDNEDRVDFIGSLDGTNVPLVVNNNTLPNNTFLIENQSVYSIANAGNAPNNGVIVSTAQPINKITFVTGKYNGNAGNVTMQLYELKYCLAPDTDGDGIADYLDLDSDNDGITDVIESGGTDTNRDGQADGNVGTSGTTNGVPSSAGTGNTPANSDSDTLPNHLDIDADNDGIPDNIEGQTSNGYIAPSGIASNITDTNNNGVDDNYESGAIIGFDPENTDGIDNPDYLDLDSDNDGITDIRENGNDNNSLTGSDSDNDGLDNAFDDNDDSSISGATVNDGLNSGNKVTDINSLENAYGDNDDNFNPGDGDLDYRDFKDSDKDGIVDSDDLDDDNDGILDTVEIASCVGSLNYEFYDSVPSGNTVDNIPTTGATATGTVTNFDVTALQEMVTPSDNQTYSIRYSGYINIPSTTNYTFYLNSDDGSKLFIDGNQVVDYDGLHGAGGLVTGDNIPLKEGLHEITVLFFENTGAHSLDVEYSSSTISRRNLPFSILSPNCDTDGDGISNHLDIDADNDGIPDNIEGQTSNGYVAPSGIGTSITDSNNNGVDDNYENGQVGLTPVNTDASNDSIPDYLDLDSDNDGIDDVLENGDTDNGASGNDTDGDGLDDNFDDNNDSNTEGSTVNDGLGSGNKVTNAATLDTAYGDQDNDFPGSGDLDYRDKNDIDNDGVADLFDLDNDNDGIPDVDEMDCSGNNLGNSAPLLGAFRDNIFWLNWDGDFTNGINLGDSKTFTMPDGSTITATVVSASAKNGLTTDFVPVDMAAWDANPNPHLKQYYDTTPDNEVLYNPSGKPSSEIDFTIRFTGLNNNIVFTPNLVVADGESTDEITEKAQYYTSGTNWELLDNIPNTFTNSSINAKEAFLEGNDTGSGGNGFYVLKSNKANTIRVVLKNTVNGSSQGVAFGIFLDCLPIDSDNDGIPNHLDLDSDNDGIPDIVEAGGTDTNGDGKVDNINANGTLINDANNNGLDDLYDVDNGGNTIPNLDSDGDGIPNTQDLDSDNDGIADIVEAGGTDTNGDGKADNFVDTDNDGFNDVVDGDVGQDGTSENIANALIVTGADTNNDGTPNSYPNGDTDNDGILDHLDLDADNDGIADVVEAGGTDTNGDGKADNFTDADNDGFNDVVDGDPTNALANGSDANGANTDNALIVTGADTNNDGTPNSYPNGDTDNDGILDHLDLDADNDGIADVVEAGGTDTNGDGKADNFTDADNDGFNDVVDGDPTNALANGSDANGANTDNALIVTGADTNNDGTPNSYPNGDTDNDGILDHLDLDADNDGIADVVEAGGTDTNGDGKADNFTDADNDGFNDVVDGDPTNALANGSDANGANTDNALIVTGADTNNNGTPNSYPAGDTDNDGILDHLDLDADNDGIADVVEAGGTDTNGDGKADNFTDADNDGFNDVVDGDPTNALANGSDANGANTDNALIVTGADTNNDGTPNSYPAGDTDNDGILDHLDLDADNDGIADVVEAGGTDTNGDGKADNFTDADNDGFNDVVDGDPTNALANGSDANGANTDNVLIVTGADTNNDGTPNSYPTGDTDNDGILDHLDLDADNDGIADVVEAGGTDTNGDGKADNFTDADNDGFNDVVDGDPTNALANGSDANGANTDNALIVTGADTNNDGTPNSYPNGDTDNDGILDHLDLDADNDGIADVVEAGGTDTNGDGKADNFTDADNDGFNDVVDGDPTNALANGSDANGANTDNALIVTGADTNNDGTPNSYPAGDTDNDGILDHLDLDADNDGIADVVEAGGTDTNGDGKADNFTDADNDGFNDVVDGDPTNALANGSDANGANTDNALIVTGADTNNDGTPNSYPNGDTDNDGILDHLDLDADNDGIADVVEAGGTDTNGDGKADNFTDADNDGFNDVVDGDPTNALANGSDANGANTDNVLIVTGADTNNDGTPNSYPTGDTDNDGILDHLDLDADNDGIADVVEAGGTDTNGDGKADNFTDADNDGFNDVVDGDPTNALANGSDANGANTDNVLIVTGADTNNDGTPNSYPTGDTDNDGILDHLDLDADNDGIADVVEAGGTDTNGDGKADNFTDADNDGFNDVVDGDPTNALANGSDANGANTDNVLIVTGADTNNDGTPNSYPAGDTDNDGILDHLDLDADNDGIADVVEAGGTDTNGDGKADNFTDADNDGFNDVVDGDPTNALANGSDANGANTDNVLIVTGADTNNDGTPNSYPAGDTDNDGILDHLDLDADNDGIADVVEAGGTDTNGDGKADNFTDADNDGFNDVVDGDPTNALANGSDANGANTDNVLIVTGADTNNDGTPNSYPNGDTDNDGKLDFIDIDADNDGIPDNIEGQTSNDYVAPSGIGSSITDANNNGVDDNYEDGQIGLTPVNTDSSVDNIPDYLDSDSDNDGILDIVENGDTDNVLSGSDIDNDGLDDNFDDNNDTSIQGSTVNDGLGNGDKVTNITNLENAYGDADNDFPGAGDLDYRDTSDRDNDGIADNIDIDDDNDGILDLVENGNNDADGDEDGDGTPNYRDTTDNGNAGDGSVTNYTDSNSDGIPDVYDFDNDGIANHIDLDADNDGIPDNIEGQSTIDYVAPSGNDADNDGLDDAYDATPNGNTNGLGSLGLTPVNTDASAAVGSDTTPDYLDLDSDGDGLFDVVESGAGLPNDGNGTSTGTFGANGLNDLAETGDTDLGYTDINGEYDNTQTDNFDDNDQDVLTVGDVDYRDITDDGIPMITQVYQFEAERWIEITNIHPTKSIAANLINIQLYKDKTGVQTTAPDVTHTVTSALAPGQSVIFGNSNNTLTNINSNAIAVKNNDLTDISGANDIITLSKVNGVSSYENRYDIIESFKDKTSYVRIDETLQPNVNYTESEWVVFIDDALDPYNFLIDSAERHPHDPLISEIESSNSDANTLLGLHRIEKTTRTGGNWNNGYPDRSRYVSVNENYEHQNERLSARKLEVLGSNILAIDNQLLVVTNNLNITTNAEIRLVGKSQFVQTHTGVADITGNGKMYVEQNSELANIYRYNYMSSPVRTVDLQTYSIESVLKDGTNPVSFAGIVGQGASNIARDINFVGGYDGSTGTPINIADYWIYTFASTRGQRSNYEHKYKSGTIAPTDGYIFKGPEVAQNYTFVGNPNDGELTTAVGGSDSYLIGNPFPSAMNALKFIKDNINSIDGSLYFWDHVGEENTSSETSGHNYQGYVGGYSTINLSMAVASLGKPAVGAFSITLEAEQATTNTSSITDQAREVVRLNTSIEFLEFNRITRATDEININYKSATGKTLIFLKDNVEVGTYDLPATSGYETFTINDCVIVGSTIRFESLDSNTIDIDFIEMNDDDGDVSCAPSSGTDSSLFKTPGTYIPIGQGFFIGGDSDGGPIVFNNSQRQYVTEDSGNAVFFKSERKKVVEQDNGDFNTLPLLKIGMDFVSEDREPLHRQIGVSFSPNNTFEFEKGFDSPINDLGATDVYWKFENSDNKYVIAGIQSVSNSLEIPFEIIMDYKGAVILNLDDIKKVNNTIFVKDKLNNKTYDITNNEVVLQLDKGEYLNRFSIVFSQDTVLSVDDANLENPINDLITTFLDKTTNELVIDNKNNLNIENVVLFNLLGQKTNSWNIDSSDSENRLKVKNIANGVYIVNIKTEKGMISKKVLYNK